MHNCYWKTVGLEKGWGEPQISQEWLEYLKTCHIVENLLEFNLFGVNKGNKEGLCLVPKRHATTNRNLVRQFFNYSKTKGELNITSGSSVRLGIRCTFFNRVLENRKACQILGGFMCVKLALVITRWQLLYISFSFRTWVKESLYIVVPPAGVHTFFSTVILQENVVTCSLPFTDACIFFILFLTVEVLLFKRALEYLHLLSFLAVHFKYLQAPSAYFHCMVWWPIMEWFCLCYHSLLASEEACMLSVQQGNLWL